MNTNEIMVTPKSFDYLKRSNGTNHQINPNLMKNEHLNEMARWMHKFLKNDSVHNINLPNGLKNN